MALEAARGKAAARPRVPRQVPRRAGPSSGKSRLQPNLGDYARVRRDFSWETARNWLTGLPNGRGLNIAYEAVDRHCDSPRAQQVAVRCRDRHGRISELTYDQLRLASNRFANLLRSLEVAAGGTVFTLLDRVPELLITALGTWKNTCVYAPLPTDLGGDQIRERLEAGNARVLVTTPELYKRKVAPIRQHLAHLGQVLVVGDGHTDDGRTGDDVVDLHPALADASEEFAIPATGAHHTAFLHYTSGTTGAPKGVLHGHEAVIVQHASGAYVLDLHATDVLWCTADAATVAGTSYGIVAPLTHGATLLVDAADSDVRGTYELMQEQRVTVWYTSPDVLDRMRREGAELARMYDLSALRFIASGGEPLPPEVVTWGQDALGRAVHDSWWQTEAAAVMVSNFASMDIRPGSMGRPLPGVKVALLARGADGRAVVEDGEVRETTDPDEVGEIAVRPGWPSMFQGYLGDERGYKACFAGGWYRTGDLARRDHDGYYWFAGRVDDVIRSAKGTLGAFEIERVVREHPGVADAAAIGLPTAGRDGSTAAETVKVFVTLAPGWTPDDDLRNELVALVVSHLPAVDSADVSFETQLPRTATGTVARRILRAREAGRPVVDLADQRPS
jgi:acetyl-CoA synthetase